MIKNLQIPNPCSEKWELMSSHEKGKFCSVCDKCVIDFTHKKHHEIINIIKEKQNEKICGRLYNDQLKTKDSKILNLKNKFFKNIPTNYRNSRITLTIFSLVLLLTGCSKSGTERPPLMGKIKIEEDTIPENDQFIFGEALIEDDSVFSKKDSIK
ncbi:hypothetical protein K0U91_09320 [Chryseobacterium chendengshani]|uniref:hypothetical protein n=1 Tax=Chryseobacterium sp. LJ668 TaxID=2864040 RepID=UPI001C68FDD0|nr:hypothetical protein [Chryseobacterium sp. LJ668]MBW8524483.1 hypothetical protein [Chryseobacterium sp. LJ668]QYK15275.1 hypothetical protein K0U91_09320 [Chryseobacterium sp. LJ668]